MLKIFPPEIFLKTQPAGVVTETGPGGRTTELCTPGGTSVKVGLGQLLHGNVPDETGGPEGNPAGGTGPHLKVRPAEAITRPALPPSPLPLSEPCSPHI